MIKKNEAFWDKTAAKEILTISELKKKKSSDTIYETEGYVVYSYKCDCPPISGAFVFCKCPPEHLIISERTQLEEIGRINNLEIRVITAPDGFERDQEYRFKVRIHETYDNEKFVEEVNLSRFDRDLISVSKRVKHQIHFR